MSYDAGLHGVAQRYFTQALRLAKTARDVPLGTEILAAMAHQAAFLGHGTQAAELGTTAMTSAAAINAHALESEAATMAAHGHALMGDSITNAKLLVHAEDLLDRTGLEDNPQWLTYYDSAYLSAKKGHCLLAAGDTPAATDAARRSLDMDPNYVRGRMFNLCLLTTALASGGQPEEACHHAREALAISDSLRSARADVYLERIMNALRPYQTTPAVAELVEMINTAS
jgi:tetratricopeptide (TPR) repeat protein